MPELPEVETVRRTLIRHGITGRTIVSVDVRWPRTVGGDEALFSSLVRDRTILALTRRGKYLVFHLTDGMFLLMHLRMSGRTWIVEKTHTLSGYERVIFRLDDDRELRFHDPRKFGRVTATVRPNEVLNRLGFEPLEGDEETRRTLWSHLRGRRRIVKSLLLDQHAIAGSGNIYTDEALWRASIHPLRNSATLTTDEIEELRRAVEFVLERGIRNLGTALGRGHANFVLPDGSERARNQEELAVFRRTGHPCPRCGTTIVRTVVSQRSTHFCPSCQRIHE